MKHQERLGIMVGVLLGAAMCGDVHAATATSPTLRWNADQLGNHRYLVQVAQPADAVHVVIPWRRRDAHPEQVNVIVTGPDGQAIANVQRGTIDRASGELVFQASKAGTYAVYYQPYVNAGRANYPTVTYAEVRDTADPAWVHKLGSDARAWRRLPSAKLLNYEAVDDFDAYTPMERTATPAELQALLKAHAGQRLWIFPETRANPIRMFDALPESWARRGPGGSLRDSALPGEYLSFQLGAWAPAGNVDNLQVSFSDLRNAQGDIIPSTAVTCFNLSGIDYAGKPFTTRVNVAAGRVQPLWMGLDVPATAKPGVYRGEVTVAAEGVSAQRLPVEITVGNGQAVAHGDDDPFKLTRLRWLNSTLAQDDELVKPFTVITVQGDTLGILGRDIALATNGLPAQISSRFDERMTGFADHATSMLAAPIAFTVEDASGTHPLSATGQPDVQKDGPARVHWQVAGNAGPLQASVKASLEADGTLSYAIALTATQATTLKDVRLTMPLASDVARYQLGLGRQGDVVPDDFQWKWNVENNQDGAWLGTVNAGLEFHLRDEHYLRPLNTNFYHQQPLRMPVSWDNHGQGGVRLHREGKDYRVEAFSGPRQMQAGETLHYDVVLRVTPFKTIEPAKHFANRYFHGNRDVDTVKADGASVVNIHHASAINPWINYPFLEVDAMRAYVDAAHQRGMKVKIYDTVRELSDRAPELPMLESLGHEVISSGKGGGFSWLQEHMNGDYIAAWHVPQNRDAAVINAGQSRWHNYYIEGLDWLARNVGIDGLYLDDVAYDRTTMKRVRKVLQAHRPDPLIDLHSANQYNERDGHNSSTLLYMELFPYLDRLWFGEYFDYEKTSPAYWLTEMSGIPYGLMGEMLQNDGNRWRGMLFGMTRRSREGGAKDSDLHALWQLWDSFGIEQSDMVGWWVHGTPVRTGRDDVLVTSYVRKGDATLIALASWAPQPTQVRLTIDWKALGLKKGKVSLVAPALEGFQPAETFKPDEAIPVEPGKGWLIMVK